MQVLERVHVGHHAARRSPGGRRRARSGRAARSGDRRARARVASTRKRQVVRCQALDVARDRPGQAEEPHRDDRNGQLEDRRTLGRARDEVPGGRHQPDAEQHREGAERARRRRDARAGRRRAAAADAGWSRSCGLARLGRDACGLARGRRRGRPGGSARAGARSGAPCGRARSRSTAVRDDAGVHGVEDRPSARRGSRAGRRAGRRARARCDGADRPRAGARRRRRACRSPAGGRATNASAPARRADRATPASSASGVPNRMLSATVPPEHGRPLRHPGDAARASAGSSQVARSTPPTVIRPSWARPGAGAGSRPWSCRRRSRPPARRSRPGAARVDAVEHEAGPRRVGERDGLEPHGRADRARRRAARPGAHGRGASSRSRSRSATATPSALAWNCAASCRIGRYSSGASTSTVSGGARPIPPLARRMPTSRRRGRRRAWRPARAPTRRGSRRGACPSWSGGSARRPPRCGSACAAPRLNARSVGRPRTTSRKCVESARSALQRARARSSV